MGSCGSPAVIELSSDSEHGNEKSEATSSQPIDDFSVDWADYYYPTSADDIVDLYSKVDNDEPDKASVSSAETETYSPQIDEEVTIIESPPKRRSSSQIHLKNDKTSQKQNEKLKKEQSKLEKKKLREEKKAQELKQKRLRAAAVQKQRILRPEENIKLLRINIDTKVVNTEFGAAIITSLQQAGIEYHVGDQIKPFTIFWTKKLKDIIVSDEGVVQENAGIKEEKELFYIIDSYKMVDLVNSNELLTHIQTVKSVYDNKCLTLIITGMENYFHSLKKNLNQGGSTQNGKRKRELKSSDSHFLFVTKEQIESALIELQIIGNCNHRMIESGEELASMVLCTTKSLSQLDYKREKSRREEGDLDWFAKADSKQCVKVDKNGNGLEKLWLQQICQFNAVGLEIASAIVSNYHSPQNLVNSYRKCSQSEGELLLQNIIIRKDAGILSSTRRIGPEISRKLYNFYMSDDPDLEL